LRQTAIAFWTAVHAAEQQRLTEQTVALAEETEHVAQRRYRVGDVGALDVNLATAAVARERSDLQAARAASDAALGALRVSLGIGADSPLAIIGELRPRRRYVLPELLERASERPDLRALEAGVREAEASVRLGRALRWPNLGVGAVYERDDGTDVAMGLVTVTLPVFERGQGATAEGLARQRRIEFELETSRRTLDIEVRAAFSVYEHRNQAVDELERGALPSLDENENLARRSYEEGQLSVAELLAVRREILDTKRQYLDRLREAAIAGVELEASAGVLQ
jgi:cobalt-zinc-cadmium efflux system outer membrane protein